MHAFDNDLKCTKHMTHKPFKHSSNKDNRKFSTKNYKLKFKPKKKNTHQIKNVMDQHFAKASYI